MPKRPSRGADLTVVTGALTMISVHSFDVFDTCLVRTVAMPDGLFFLAAEAVLLSRRERVAREEIVELMRMRIAAKRSARAASEREEVALEKIYHHMDLGPWGITADEMMEEELRLESESVRPVASIRAELKRLRREDEEIIFISDTSIPTKHLKEMLEKAGVAGAREPLYTSGELGITKKSGQMFEYLKEEEGWRVDGWVHHGDDPQGDVEAPISKGIRVVPFRDADLTRYERILLAEGGDEPWVRSRVVGASRVARLSVEIDSDNAGSPALSEFAADVVAPLLTSFMVWVIEKAREEGVERLYFMSRDGDILFHIVRELEKRMPVPEYRYLYGSRQAWLLSAITSLEPDDLHWILDGSPTLSDLLARLSLEPAEVAGLLDAHGLGGAFDRRLRREVLEQFWEFLSDPDVASMVLSRAEQARRVTLAYLEREGLTSTGKWALVDVGWKLRSQWALKRTLDTIGKGDSVSGYYLGVSHRRRAMAETGPYRAMLMPEESKHVRILLERAMVIEEVFLSADHGSVKGYEWLGGRAVPVLGDWGEDQRRSRYLSEIRKVVTTYAREAHTADLLDDHHDHLRRGALRVTEEFLMRPTRAEAETVVWMTAVDDLTHDTAKARPLAVPLGPGDALGRAVMGNLGRLHSVQRYRSEPKRYYWEEGSLALSRPWIRALFRLVSSLRLRKFVEVPANTAKRLRLEIANRLSAGR